MFPRATSHSSINPMELSGGVKQWLADLDTMSAK